MVAYVLSLALSWIVEAPGLEVLYLAGFGI